MTPEQALEILDQIAAMAPVNRATHVQAQKAIETLRWFVSNAEQKEATEETSEVK